MSDTILDSMKLRNRHEKSFGLNADKKTTYQKVALVTNLIVNPEDPDGELIPDPDTPTLESSGGASAAPEYTSPTDFLAEFISSTQIAISQLKGFSVEDSSQLVSVKVIHADETSEMFTNYSGGITLLYANGTISIVGATPFVSGDVYEVGINGQKKAYDPESQSNLVSNITEPKLAPTSVEHLEISTAAIGTTVEILRGFNYHQIHEFSGMAAADHSIKLYWTLNEDADETLASKLTWTDITNEVFASTALTNLESLKGLLESMPIKLAVEITAAVATTTASDIYYNHYSN